MKRFFIIFIIIFFFFFFAFYLTLCSAGVPPSLAAITKYRQDIFGNNAILMTRLGSTHSLDASNTDQDHSPSNETQANLKPSTAALRRPLTATKNAAPPPSDVTTWSSDDVPKVFFCLMSSSKSNSTPAPR
jgi:hypothetical protein